MRVSYAILAQAGMLPLRPANGHKGTFGKVQPWDDDVTCVSLMCMQAIIIGGGMGTSGAPYACMPIVMACPVSIFSTAQLLSLSISLLHVLGLLLLTLMDDVQVPSAWLGRRVSGQGWAYCVC